MASIDFVRRLSLAFEPLEISEPGRVLAIAHGALESGWARSHASSAHNFWNLCATPDWKGAILQAGDVEYDGAGHVRPIFQRFKAYASDYEAACNYLHVLQWPRYLPAYRELLVGNAVEFARKLREDDPSTKEIEGGFYTTPLPTYTSDLAACLAAVRGILRPAEVVG